jgi:hypothetical protein
MSRRHHRSIVADAALLVVLGALFVAGRASAGPGIGYGPGMMAGYAGGTAPASATRRIRHQVAHCHAWSPNELTVVVRRPSARGGLPRGAIRRGRQPPRARRRAG